MKVVVNEQIPLEKEKEFPKKETPGSINVENLTTENRDVEVLQSHYIDKLTTNSDVANNNVEKLTTSLISPTPLISNQGT